MKKLFNYSQYTREGHNRNTGKTSAIMRKRKENATFLKIEIIIDSLKSKKGTSSYVEKRVDYSVVQLFLKYHYFCSSTDIGLV